MNPSYRLLIAEDEPPATQRLRHFLKQHPHWEVAGCVEDGLALLEALKKEPVDLVLLDIQMPGLSGLDAWSSLKPSERPEVIMVTAYDRFAVKAFEMYAVDYLLKPFSSQRFQLALERAEVRLKDRQTSEHLAQEQESVASAELSGRLAIREQGKIHLVNLKEISHVSAAGNYLEIHHQQGSHFIRHTLSQLAKELPEKFFLRIHRSHVVNLHWVDQWQIEPRQDGCLLLKNGTSINIGRHYREALRKRMHDMMVASEQNQT